VAAKAFIAIADRVDVKGRRFFVVKRAASNVSATFSFYPDGRGYIYD
jgi:hypothetical protein